MSDTAKQATEILGYTLAQIENDPVLATALIDAYIATFNAVGDGEWAESWTPESVRQKLFGVAEEIRKTTAVALYRVDGAIVGFTIAAVGTIPEIVTLKDLPAGLQTAEHLKGVHDVCSWIGGGLDGRSVFVREMGILPTYRGGLAPVIGMLLRCVSDCVAFGAEFGCLWTNKASKIYAIVKALAVRDAYRFGDHEEHILLADSAPLFVRRLKRPPAEIIARLQALSGGA